MKPINAIYEVNGTEQKVKIVAFSRNANFEPLAVFINETQHLDEALLYRFHQCQLSDFTDSKAPSRQNDPLLDWPEKQPRCPDCGETEFTHCPLDDADYVCKGCGLWYN